MTGVQTCALPISRVPSGVGIQVLEDSTESAPPVAPSLEAESGHPSGWWFHLGYTGPALFYRPSDKTCISLLLNRRGPNGELLDAEALRARRWGILLRSVGQSGR